MLGPVDPQLGQYPAASILKAVSRKPVERVKDDTLILADQSEKAISQVRESVRELLTIRSHTTLRSASDSRCGVTFHRTSSI